MKLRFFAYFFTIVAALLALPSCETPPSSSDNSEWRRPPRYGSGGSQSDGRSSSSRSDSASSRNSGSSRFGYSGNERSRPETSDTSSSRDRDRNEDTASAEKPQKEEKKEPASSDNSGNLGYAIGVPGKPLSVTLPGAAKSLGPISIEKYDASGNPTGEPLPRGTPVEIPDPNNPGKKIQFKVP